MNIITLVWSYLQSRLMSTLLNVVLLSLGTAVITLLILVGHQLEDKISRNSKGIDLVVGAKGSPLQLILSSVYHIDFPTGNIKLAEAEKLAKNRLVKKAIPLALGDSYRGFRIVGTDTSYANLYGATLQAGKWWSAGMDVVIGSQPAEQLKLTAGDTFMSAHGLTEEGAAHEEHPYRVVGILAPSGTVLDNLILTNVESVWEVHIGHSEVRDPAFEGIPSPLVPSVGAGDTTKEITSMLIKFRNPLAALKLPRLINSSTFMQAASPAFETARLYTILGAGVDALTALSAVLIGISGLSIFLALYTSLRDRRYDLAIMRAMGASRLKLFVSLLLEGSILTLAGSLLGIAVAHLVLAGLSGFIGDAAAAGFNASALYIEELYLLLGSLVLGVLCSALPALEAYRTDIHATLAGN
jgi:putative ABC transport system permease protein